MGWAGIGWRLLPLKVGSASKKCSIPPFLMPFINSPIPQYVVFPGNVGSTQALLEAVQKLSHHQVSSSPPLSSAIPTRPLFIPSSSSRTLDLVEAARAKGHAVGAFNVYNLEGVRAVVLAAAATDSSAILQVHPSSFDFGGAPLLELCRAARLYLEKGDRPGEEDRNRIAVHLDHAHEAASIERVLVRVFCKRGCR